MITKKIIEERKQNIIVDISTVKERLIEYEQKKLEDTALVNALTGALQQCEYFLKQIDDDEPEMAGDDGNDS
jgi:PIN domain nuclease of toxin-antitoxin system